MANYDTLQYNGIERTFAKRGFSLSSVKGAKYNLREDIFRATIAGANISDDPVFPFEAQVIVRTGRASASGADNSFSGGTVKFSGKRVGTEGSATGRGQGVAYEFLGPWYDLSNTHYLQTFKGVAVLPYAPGEVVLNTSTVNNLNTLFYISIGDQIQAVLQWLLDQYAAQGMAAPFQYVGRDLNAGAIDLSVTGNDTVGINTNKAGNLYNLHVNAATTVDTALFAQFLPSYIAKPMMCSQALEKMLELSPRTNISFDYSTTPPTVYVRSVDNFAPVALPLFNGIDHKSLNIKRRDDLVARAVVITYRITNTIDGRQKVDYAIDKWGPHGSNSALDPGTGLRVLSETIDLQGFNITTTTAQMDCEPLASVSGTNATKRKWWSSRRGGEQAKFIDSRLRFQDSAFAETAIPDATLTYATTGGTDSLGNLRVAGASLSAADLALFTNRIVNGSHHPWMASGTSPVFALKVRVSVKTEHALYDVVAGGDMLYQLPSNESASNTAINGTRHGKVNTEETHCEVQLTNATNAVDGSPYTATTEASSQAGELYIVGNGGIAQYLFNALQPHQYDGEYAKVEADFANNVSLTNAVNFTGGRAEWTTMNAQPQSIIEDYGTREKFMQIGVSRHLTAGQLSSLLNMWAYRRTWYNPAMRADNSVPNGGQVNMPDAMGSANATDGITNHNELVTTDYAMAGDPASVVKAQIKASANKVTGILAATTPTPVDPAIKPEVIDPKEITCCDESGNAVQVIGLFGGFYTKP
ncbi:MAG TPA: hypothetical protein VH597_00260 [Verrucomicrobiae bacterium]|jgi:hypothetical protein|nr:hypothetical protein [Verrucomicrobiae bacterium]